jgi:hypothetical protein
MEQTFQLRIDSSVGDEKMHSMQWRRDTVGRVKGYGVTHLLIFCGRPECRSESKMPIERFPDDTDILSIGARMRCGRCGRKGADVRPDWIKHRV